MLSSAGVARPFSAFCPKSGHAAGPGGSAAEEAHQQWARRRRGGALRDSPPRPHSRPLTLAAMAQGVDGAADGPLYAPGEPAGSLRARLATLAAAAGALYRFTRPHTMLGTCISVVSVSFLALGPAGLIPEAALALAQALPAALLMNICIVGINQVYDVEIDRVNKPYLPLAAGDFTVATGVAVSALCGAAALGIGLLSGSQALLGTLGGSLALGIAYSADCPLLRWKRSPVAAAACILAVRAVLVQLGFYAHMRVATGASAELSRPIVFATAFMLLFSVVIALFKDIPDIKGDQQAGLRTLSVRLGPSQVYWACILLLEAAYAGAVGLALFASSPGWRSATAAAAHFALGVLLLWRARRTDLGSSKSIYDCYMDVWKLFYLEYLLLPLLA